MRVGLFADEGGGCSGEIGEDGDGAGGCGFAGGFSVDGDGGGDGVGDGPDGCVDGREWAAGWNEHVQVVGLGVFGYGVVEGGGGGRDGVVDGAAILHGSTAAGEGESGEADEFERAVTKASHG